MKLQLYGKRVSNLQFSLQATRVTEWGESDQLLICSFKILKYWKILIWNQVTV